MASPPSFANGTLYASGGSPLITAQVYETANGEEWDRLIDRTLTRWKSCPTIRALDSGAAHLRLRLASAQVTDKLGDDYLTFQTLDVSAPRKPTLAWCGPAAPQVVNVRAASAFELDQMEHRAPLPRLLDRAMAGLPRWAGQTWSAGRSSGLVVARRYLVIRVPVRMSEGDDRGYVMQVWNRLQRRLLWSAFGHPEWATESEHVQEISADLFLRFPGASGVLMLGRYGKGWESTSRAIYDLESGRPLLIAP